MMFREVDAEWRAIMNRVNTTPAVLSVTSNAELLTSLQTALVKLETIQAVCMLAIS